MGQMPKLPMVEQKISRGKNSLAGRILHDENGQMSIFVALIFQVLFVLFAMVINVGLLVHDKINLQNSVDFGAYYGAERQAELLNEIAHINYQIRQDYKLLTWRYRVIGTLGREDPGSGVPPARTVPPAPPPPEQALTVATGPDTSTPIDPIVCVAHVLWKEFAPTSTRAENYCRQHDGEMVKGIQSFPVIASWIGLNSVAASFTQLAQKNFVASCSDAAPLNWSFTVQMLYAFRQSVAVRKMMIESLRQNLVTDDFTDLDNQSVKAGVIQTVKKNLTVSNLNNPSLNIEVLNGLTQGGCDANAGEFLLPEIRIAPLLEFMDSEGIGNNCTFTTRFHTQYQSISEAGRRKWDPTGVMELLSQGEPDPKDPLHSSLGFEKNPWCMAYVGVKATSAPRKPFAPFGTAVQLQARSFAQPFGGRIGPWYTSRWTKGAAFSNTDETLRVDRLTTPRLNPGIATISYTTTNLPNFSRFPGDTLGLNSQLAQAAERNEFNTLDRKKGIQLSLAYYGGFEKVPLTGDPLVWDTNVPDETPLEKTTFVGLRNAEVAAIEPDIFDVTYYSIDPAYYQNYHLRHLANPGRFQLAPIFGIKTTPISDLGSRSTNPELASYQVDTQINTAMTLGLDPTILPGLPYPIRTWEHLLTSWAPNNIVDYSFPTSRFGQCQTTAMQDVMIPGKCAAGGRVGYSVRLISREHLLFDDWSVGGDGEATGGLLNKPPLSF